MQVLVLKSVTLNSNYGLSKLANITSCMYHMLHCTYVAKHCQSSTQYLSIFNLPLGGVQLSLHYHLLVIEGKLTQHLHMSHITHPHTSYTHKHTSHSAATPASPTLLSVSVSVRSVRLSLSELANILTPSLVILLQERSKCSNDRFSVRAWVKCVRNWSVTLQHLSERSSTLCEGVCSVSGVMLWI